MRHLSVHGYFVKLRKIKTEDTLQNHNDTWMSNSSLQTYHCVIKSRDAVASKTHRNSKSNLRDS